MVGRGFYLFKFISKEDRDLIFHNGPYFMGPQGLYLNRWTSDFDPTVDVPKVVTIWDCLPNLLIHCWTPSLWTIGDKLGKYIDNSNPKENYSCARICIEVDLEVGLPEAIKLMVGEWKHYQKLDYERFPFKCWHCHDYGNFQKNYLKMPIEHSDKEAEDGWTQARRAKTSTKQTQKKMGEIWDLRIIGRRHDPETPTWRKE